MDFPPDTVAELLGWITLAMTLGGLLMWGRKQSKRVTDFLDDWNGQAARPGVAERKGVLERLQDTENNLDTLSLLVAELTKKVEAK